MHVRRCRWLEGRHDSLQLDAGQLLELCPDVAPSHSGLLNAARTYQPGAQQLDLAGCFALLRAARSANFGDRSTLDFALAMEAAAALLSDSCLRVGVTGPFGEAG
jgi:hypothetical protein